jgi:hypothetical protein
MAKNKRIDNVIASGDEQNPSLSGTNGFELKSLPQVKWEEKKKAEAVRVTPKDMLAYAIRSDTYFKPANELRSNFAAYIDNLRKEKFDFSKFRSMSQYFTIEEFLVGDDLSILGYRVIYKGPEPFKITRIEVNDNHRLTEVIIQPNSNICLSKAELALLGSKIELECRFNNGCILDNIEYGVQEEQYKFLRKTKFCKYECGDNTYRCTLLYGAQINNFVNKSDIETYFLEYKSNTDNSKNEKLEKELTNKNGIFGMFKR